MQIADTADRVQNADYVQDADWVQCKMQTDKKNCFFVVRNVVTFDFIKFSFSGNPLAYGIAEANEMIAS